MSRGQRSGDCLFKGDDLDTGQRKGCIWNERSSSQAETILCKPRLILRVALPESRYYRSMSESNGRGRNGRWERRERRRSAERRRQKQHGAAIKRVYHDAILKRLRAARSPSSSQDHKNGSKV